MFSQVGSKRTFIIGYILDVFSGGILALVHWRTFCASCVSAKAAQSSVTDALSWISSLRKKLNSGT